MPVLFDRRNPFLLPAKVAALLFLCALSTEVTLSAQISFATAPSSVVFRPELVDSSGLPESPGSHLDSSGTELSAFSPTSEPSKSPRFAPASIAPLYNKYIEPGQRVQPLTGPGRKLDFGIHQIASPYFVVAVLSSAGYDHVIDGTPNYGTDRGAFGQRLGAAAITNAAQSIFTDGLMPAVFHQDPHYYVMGKNHNFAARTVYAISRVLITRSDQGATAPNYSLFAGHAETVALQNAYFPDVNRGFTETSKNFANSFAGTALSNGIREFFPDLLHLIHLE